MTVPDMSLTIRELVYNHTRGIGVDIHQPIPQYFDMEIPRINDLTDLDAFRDDVNAKRYQTTKEVEKDQENARNKAKQALEEKLRKEAEQEAKRQNFVEQ